MASSSHTCIVAFVKTRRYLLLLKSGDMGDMDDIFVIWMHLLKETGNFVETTPPASTT